MNKCINCGEEFTAERTTAKFCSDKCRKYYGRRKLSGTNDPLKSLSGTDSGTKDSLSGTKDSLSGTNDTLKSLSGSKPDPLTSKNVVNKMAGDKTGHENEEMNKTEDFIKAAIAKKISQGPDHPLNKDKFDKRGRFITYFKKPMFA